VFTQKHKKVHEKLLNQLNHPSYYSNPRSEGTNNAYYNSPQHEQNKHQSSFS